MSVAAARQRYQTLLANGAALADFTEGAPTLVDSRFSSEVQRALDRFDDQQLLPYPRLAFAAGRLAALAQQVERAARLLTAAASAGRADVAVTARAFWELGCLQLGENKAEAAEVVLALAHGALGDAAGSAADVIHLEALIADRRGDVESARRMYRSAIAAGGGLSPLTRITAMRNLAASLTHVEPYESIGLCELATALVDADLLDDRARPTISNVQAYALLCTGQLADAIAQADQTYEEATRFGHGLIASYARFNRAIAHELKDEFGAASAELEALLATTNSGGELRGWIRLRLGWLALKSADVASAKAILLEVSGDPRRQVYGDACATLRALIAFHDRDLDAAAGALEKLADRYAEQGDQLTAFVLLLWCARASSEADSPRAARAALTRAAGLASTHGFRISPNWWSADLAEFARETADGEAAPLLAGLLTAGGQIRPHDILPRPVRRRIVLQRLDRNHVPERRSFVMVRIVERPRDKQQSASRRVERFDRGVLADTFAAERHETLDFADGAGL